jgi:hypothetical protein
MAECYYVLCRGAQEDVGSCMDLVEQNVIRADVLWTDAAAPLIQLISLWHEWKKAKTFFFLRCDHLYKYSTFYLAAKLSSLNLTQAVGSNFPLWAHGPKVKSAASFSR